MACTLVAKLAVLFDFQAVRMSFFVLGDGVVPSFAVSTLQRYNLSHCELRKKTLF
jgi:hypothetical protein